MIRTAVAIAALSLSASALAATTATITRVDGEVMVNQGEQFIAAQPGQVLATGDRILVPQGAFSSLTFEDGCVLDVQPDTLVMIPESSTCDGARAATTPQATPSGAGGGATAAAGKGSVFGWSYLATVVAVILFYDPDGDEDDDDTASP